MNRLRLKAGNIEIEIESDNDITPEALASYLTVAETFSEKMTVEVVNIGGSTKEEKNIEQSKGVSGIGSINTVCARLNASSGRDILIAAAAYLTIVESRDRFPRDDWTKLANTSNGWKKSFTNNRATNIKRLVSGGDIIEYPSSMYGLNPTLISEFEAKIVG